MENFWKNADLKRSKMRNFKSHYEKNNRAKIPTTTFYIPILLLEQLEYIAIFSNESRNKIVERSLIYEKTKSWELSQKKKKIFVKKAKNQRNQKQFQKAKYESKSLFD